MKKKSFISLLILAVAIFIKMTVVVFAWPIPDTGQTQSYTNTFGEDADYTINPHSYTDLGNGIVRDNVTGLEWVKDGNLIKTRDPAFDTDGTAGDGMVTWQHALDYVDKLNNENYLNYSDWRLPTVKELSTLVDSGGNTPAIDTTYFSDTVASYYWSSTTVAGNTNNAWFAQFSNRQVHFSDKTSSYYVRAVRGGPYGSLDNLVNNGDGTVTDTSTGLQWQATTPGRYDWWSALTYCENLILNNDGQWTNTTSNESGAKYSDWRLPNRNELQSIVDYSKDNPSIDLAYFPGTVANYYWSSTSLESIVAWLVDFRYGSVNPFYKLDPYHNLLLSYYVRAVRGGPCGYFGDSDLDGICDDGDASGVVGDNPCTGGSKVFCDDNCPYAANADQADVDGDGIGDACTSTLINLSSFTATPKSGKIILQWTTESETDNAGFNIYRATSENGTFVKINDSLIAAQGSSSQGASYEFIDKDVKNRKTYYYKLEDIDLNGQSTMHGPVSATPRWILGLFGK